MASTAFSSALRFMETRYYMLKNLLINLKNHLPSQIYGFSHEMQFVGLYLRQQLLQAGLSVTLKTGRLLVADRAKDYTIVIGNQAYIIYPDLMVLLITSAGIQIFIS